MKRDELPAEPEALKDLVMSNQQLAEMYKYKYDCMVQRYFGHSSEKIKDPAGQQLLFELPAEPGKPEPALDSEKSKEAPKRHGGGRQKLPPELERKRVEHTLPESERECSCCGETMQPFGEETSEQLEYIPASLFVIEHARIKYACKACQEKPAIAPVPEKVIDKGLAGPGLLAWVAVSKFADHLPLYRQENIFARHGLEIARSTQCAWLGQIAALLEPLYLKIGAEIKLSSKLHTDDTTIAVLDPGRGKTRTARFWVYVGDDEHPYTFFDYTPSRKRDGPETFLEGFKGYLQADAYSGYDRLCMGPDVIEVACWAHARRKFFESRETDARALEVLSLIAELYAVESLARPILEKARKKTGAERAAALAQAYALRLQLRQLHSEPILERIRVWLNARSLDTLPKSPIGAAVQYARKLWTALCRFTQDGRLEIDNNTAENALRPIAVGRKNYLFLGNDKGGRRAAILYSLIRTCDQHGINPWKYLYDVLTRISTHPAKDIAALLPGNWKPLA